MASARLRAVFRTARGFLVLLALLAAPWPGTWAAPAPGEIERLARLFDSVVFGSEIAGVAPATRVRKWSGEVRFKLGGPSAAAVREIVHRHAAHLGTLTALAYREIGARDPGENLVILIVPRAEMFEAGKHFEKNEAILGRIVEDARGHCYFLSYSQADRIVYAAIVANAELERGKLASCLLEEMTQVLGLPNDDPGLRQPVSGYPVSPGGTGLAPAAELMARTLYDPRLKPGMDRAAAAAAARAVLGGLLK